ncbi:hypothetical protein DCAR_0206534 [Daucus carota subsp. sativus]|uniref:Uncharacterized protein n=1 Tax=Daucus carota subsp. sativus TaxID=79200 RepID=A0A161Y6F4_DAUCS|nr:hypothetical protein DCAR_0206534 [Daucus carota subsp. sativus]
MGRQNVELWTTRHTSTTRFERRFFVSKGCAVSFYLPLVPIDRIAKMFKASENGHGLSNGDADVVMSQ